MIASFFGFLLFFPSAVQLELEDAALSLCASPVAFHKQIVLSICKNEIRNGEKYGICWSENPSPSIFNRFVLFRDTSTSFEHKIQDLIPNTTYYFSFFRLTIDGKTTYFQPFEAQTMRELKLGDFYQGGIICYIYKPKDALYIEGEQHGLILSKEDLGYAKWGMHGKPIESGTSVKIGAGSTNTEKIIKQYGPLSSMQFSSNNNTLQILHPCAAWLCAQYESGGWEDWFLPSKGEFEALYLEYDHIPNLGLNSIESYWSSSEVFFSYKLDREKRKESTSHHRRAWQTRVRSQNLIIYTMTLKKTRGLVRAMRYF